MRNNKHSSQLHAGLPNIYEYKENIECDNFDTISPEGDLEEMKCQSDSSPVSLSFARRLKLQRNTKAAKSKAGSAVTTATLHPKTPCVQY